LHWTSDAYVTPDSAGESLWIAEMTDDGATTARREAPTQSIRWRPAGPFI